MFFKKAIKIAIISLLLLPVYSIAETGSNQDKYFPEIPGFNKSGKVATYNPSNLFEYMNGAAELYLLYDFTGSRVQLYKDKNGNTITVEIYDQQNINNSFGMYSQERPYEGGEFFSIGAQANYTEGNLNFFQDKYYVKIVGYGLEDKDKELLSSTAKKVSGLLGTDTLMPDTFKVFPETGKIKNREEYISKDFLGYTFFEKVFSAEYGNPDASYKLFIIKESDRTSLEKSINEYKKEIKAAKDLLNGEIHEIEDPYQGKLVISISGNYIAGILNPDDVKIDINILKKAISNLK